MAENSSQSLEDSTQPTAIEKLRAEVEGDEVMERAAQAGVGHEYAPAAKNTEQGKNRFEKLRDSLGRGS